MISINNFNKMVLKNVNLKIFDGVTFIKGRNGAGKTTLLNCLAGIDKDYEGTIIGNDSIVYLNQNLYFEDRLKVKDFVKFVLGISGVEDYKKTYFNNIEKYCDIFEFKKFWERQLGTLSGGERQIIYISLIFCIDREWYILDEPFSAVDQEARNIIINMINNVVSMGKSVIITNHDKVKLDEVINANIINLDDFRVEVKNENKLESKAYRFAVLISIIFVCACVGFTQIWLNNNTLTSLHSNSESKVKDVWHDSVVKNRIEKQLKIEGKSNKEEIEYLSIRNKDVNSLNDIIECSKLKELELVNCNLKNIDELAKCESLHTLNIAGNNIENMSVISKMHCLKKVNILNTGWTNIDVLNNIPLVIGRSADIKLVFHYNREDKIYSDWYVWIWNDEIQGQYYKINDLGECEININTKIDNIGFVITKEQFKEKDVEADRYVYILNNQGNNRIDVYVDQGSWDVKTLQ